MPSRSHALPYRSDIDGMRAIAVAAVVVFHAFPALLPCGFLGVDVFFVISGYLITGLIRAEVKAGTFSLSRFYARRVRRIAPALLIVLATVLVAGWFMLLPIDYRTLGANVVGGALFFANIQFWLESGYFDKAAQLKPLLHLWSLSVEEQFYLVWPFVILWVTAARANILRLMVGIGAASFVADVVIYAHSPDAAFYLPFARFWELMIGAIVAVMAVRDGPRYARSAEILAAACILVIVASVVVGIAMKPDGSVHPWWNLLPTTATAGLIALGPDTWIGRILLSAKPMIWLGKISYPLYLWHWPILAFLRIDTIGEPSVFARLVAVIVAVALAWLTYVTVEKPIRFGAGHWVPRLGIALLAVAALGTVDARASGFPDRIPEPLRDYVVTGYDWSAGARSNQCWVTITAPYNAYAPDCYREIRRGEESVLVWGDSHAGRLYVGIARALAPRVNVRDMTRDSCPPLVGYSKFPICNNANAFALKMMAKYRPDVVLMYATWSSWGQFTNGDQSALALLKTIAEVRATGVKQILLVGPPPIWGGGGLPNLLAKEWLAAPSAGIPGVMKRGLAPEIFGVDARLRSLVAAPAIYISLTDHLCSTAGCRTLTAAGSLMTADYGHLTTAGAIYVTRFLPLQHMLTSLKQKYSNKS